MTDSQTLYLLRHARAAPWSPGLDDLERPLDERGRTHMEKLAAWAKAHLSPPDTILCSPAMRTRQSLEQLSSHWIRSSSAIHIESDLYEATTGRLQKLVENAFRSTRRLLVIGHNPGLEYLAHLIADGPSRGATGKMTMGTLAVFQFSRGWEESGGKGRIRHWLGRDHFD